MRKLGVDDGGMRGGLNEGAWPVPVYADTCPFPLLLIPLYGYGPVRGATVDELGCCCCCGGGGRAVLRCTADAY